MHPDTPTTVDHHCRQGAACAEREAVYDQNGKFTGGFIGRALYGPGLCALCIAGIDDALCHLPGDVAELTTMLPWLPCGELGEWVTGGCCGPRLPMREHLHLLIELIAWESACWAESLADYAQVPWDTQWEAQSRLGHRVQNACELMRYRLVQLLELPATRHLAHSLGEDPAAGHNPATLEWVAGRWQVVRDGVAGAMVLAGLDRQARSLAKRSTAPHHEPGRCPGCGRSDLRRQPGENQAHCGHCRRWWALDDLDVLRTAVADRSLTPAR
ncbi:MAG: hypothetical protein ACRDZY_14325 [Acidimicrobiales bacterium]